MSTGRLRRLLTSLLLPVICFLLPDPVHSQPSQSSDRYVILVLTDGLRWQEVFRGADRELMGKSGGVQDTAALRRDFWRVTPEARRATLLPFVWGTMATQGQIFGDSAQGSVARITNTFRFSYPGYSETFTGVFDPRIDRNSYPPNPNITVFEWLNRDAALRGQVAAYATWSAFGRIFNAERSGLPVYDGWERAVPAGDDPRLVQLRSIYANSTRLWTDVAPDALMHASLSVALDRALPRALFIGYGETDEWAHAGRYDMYLRAAQQVDRYLAELWARVQADPRTRGKTTLLLSTDHGRGWGREWTDHGEKVAGAEFIWSAAIGPDVPPLGVRANTPTTQAQMAATVAAALGRDWRAVEPRAAVALPLFRR